MRKLFVILIALAVSGCGSPFVERTAQFVGYNNSNDNIVALVNDGEEHPIPANRSVNFTVRVPVPKNPVQMGYISYPSGPSTIDKVVQVSVAFRNLATGRLSTPIMCQAGAKVVTTIWYEVSSYGYESSRCTSSY
ncbi:MAG: hypothetical protein Q8Q92_04620 [bacterium]|nr:hypothetical protein [bacterium]